MVAAETETCESELAAVSGLIEIPEIHVDGQPA